MKCWIEDDDKGRWWWAKTSVREKRRNWLAGLTGCLEAGWEPENSVWYENRQISVAQPSLRLNSAGKAFLFPPKFIFSLPPASITSSITLSVPSPDRFSLTQQTLSNTPDGLGEIHSPVCIHLNHCNALFYWDVCKKNQKKTAQQEACYKVMSGSQHPEGQNLMSPRVD